MAKINKGIIATVGAALAFGAAVLLSGTTYYVSPSGSDANPCTQSAPCKTITKALSAAGSGDSVSVDAGVYREYVYISKPVTLVSNGATVDGTNAAGTVREGLVEVRADNVTIQGFTIANAKVYGLANFGSNNKFLNNVIHHTQGAGIWNRDAKNNLFEGNELYFSVLQNSTSFNGSYYICNANNNTGWPSAINSWGSAQDNVWRGNFIHDNCGEGIVSILNDVIDGNTFQDNWSIEIYISKANATVTNNTIIDTRPYIVRGANQAWRSVPAGISIGDETNCLTDNSVIRGNTITGARYGVSFYQYVSCSGIKNSVIENNTIVNAWEYGLRILSGAHVNSVIRNNTITLTTGKPLTVQSTAFSITGNVFASGTNVFEYNGKTYNFASFNSAVPGNSWGSVTALPSQTSTSAKTPTSTPTATRVPISQTSTPVVDSKCDPKYLPTVCIYLLP